MQEIASKLNQLREQENEMNRQMGVYDRLIRDLKRRKVKLAKRISHNMKYRNLLINEYSANHDKATSN